MAGMPSWRRVATAAAVMILVGQVLAIANDVYLRQSDPGDTILLGVLILLMYLVLRRVPWARLATIALVTLGGVLFLAGFGLLVAARMSPQVASAIPASLRAAVAGFIASPAFFLLALSVLVSGALDLVAAGMLAFAPSVRSIFRTHRPASSA